MDEAMGGSPMDPALNPTLLPLSKGVCCFRIYRHVYTEFFTANRQVTIQTDKLLLTSYVKQ